MALSWISRRKISPTQPDVVVTVHDPQYLQAGLAGTIRVRLEDYVCGERIATSLRLPVPGVREGMNRCTHREECRARSRRAT
jgi:hypothetical protein